MPSAMKNQGNVATDHRVGADGASWRCRPDCRPSLLHWVTRQDVLDLQEALRLGWVPPDFERKLTELAGGGFVEQQIERNCRLLIALLTAACNGSFREITRA